MLSTLFSSDRQGHRLTMRSNYSAHRLQYREELSQETTTYQIPRYPDQQNIGFLNQQFCLTGADHLPAVSLPMAGGAVLQMDQATPAHQVIFRYLRECRQDANLDSCVRVCPDRHHKKAAQHQTQSLHNFTDIECHRFRANTFKSSVFRL